MRLLRRIVTLMLAALVAFTVVTRWDQVEPAVKSLWQAGSEVVHDIASGREEPATQAGERVTVVEDYEGGVAPIPHGLRYSCLEAGSQPAYDAIYEGLIACEESFNLHAAEDEVSDAYWAVLADHPEIFWVDGFSYRWWWGPIQVFPHYNVDVGEIDATRQQIEQVADGVLAAVPQDMATYDKVRMVYEWVIEACDYAADAPNSQNIQSVFLGRRSVCAGYSSAFQYLCQRMGVPCAYISGTATGRGDHAWNLVDIDGTNTYVDVTWGDPTFMMSDGSMSAGGLSYDYFCVTSEEMARDHVVTAPTQGLPECWSRDYDYFMLHGTYLDSYSQVALEALLAHATWQGETSLYFKLATPEDFEAACAYLRSQEVFWGPLSNFSALSMTYNANMYTIDVSWS